VSLIVSDNSPINLLIRLGLEDILPAIYGQVVIPTAVAAEMSHPNAPLEVTNFIASPPSWVSIRSPVNPLHLPSLGAGEVAAISLAVEMNAELMIDESAGRLQAMSLGLLFTGAVGVLERAANENLLPDLATVHAAIRTMNFRVSGAVLDDSLARHLKHRSTSPP